jgi:hypothetical protein
MTAELFSDEVATLVTSTNNLSLSALSEASGRDLSALLAPPGFRGIPRYLSPLEGDLDLSAAERGANEIHLPLMPQGYQVAALLEAKGADGRPLYRYVAVEIPRRGTKTESIRSVLLGRCLTIPGYKVLATAQDGTRAAKAMKELFDVLEANESTEYTTYRSNGGEEIRFANGSRWQRVPPKSGAFRGSAADVLWFDEAGEYDAEHSETLIQGALPVILTRPNAQVIVSGTPAAARSGLLWKYLQAAQAGESKYGAIDYGLNEDDDPEDEDVWWRCHPGLACGLIDIEGFRQMKATMTELAFMTEMLAYWPLGAADRAISPEAWSETAEVKRLPDTDRFTIGLRVNADESTASLVAAWRDTDGMGHIAALDHKEGWGWVAKRVYDLLVKYPKARFVHDEVGANFAAVETLLRESKVRSRVVSVKRKDVQAGQADLVRQLHAGTVAHPAEEPSLDFAAEVLVWQQNKEGRWFAWARSDGDITPIAAAALALWDVDQNPKRGPQKPLPLR